MAKKKATNDNTKRKNQQLKATIFLLEKSHVSGMIFLLELHDIFLDFLGYFHGLLLWFLVKILAY